MKPRDLDRLLLLVTRRADRPKRQQTNFGRGAVTTKPIKNQEKTDAAATTE